VIFDYRVDSLSSPVHAKSLRGTLPRLTFIELSTHDPIPSPPPLPHGKYR
jgi:hypothetical protein